MVNSLNNFREMGAGDDAPSLKPDKPMKRRERRRLAKYLANGTIVMPQNARPTDIVSGKHRGYSPHLMSDGTYVWSQDLAYYVEHYGTNLPEEFIEQTKVASQPNALSHDQINEVRQEMGLPADPVRLAKVGKTLADIMKSRRPRGSGPPSFNDVGAPRTDQPPSNDPQASA